MADPEPAMLSGSLFLRDNLADSATLGVRCFLQGNLFPLFGASLLCNLRTFQTMGRS